MGNSDNSKKYSIGSICIEGIEPTEDYKKYIELESLGLATDEEKKCFVSQL